MRIWLIIGVLALVSFVAFRGCFGGSSTSWNQRLTLVIETSEGEVRGSAVTKVSFSPRNKIILRDLDSSTLRLRGEAAMVEVFPGRWLFALLPDQEYLFYSFLTDQQPDGHIGIEEAVPLILDQREPIYLDLMPLTNAHKRRRTPMLVTFDDITKPETVREVDPQNLAAVFGEGVRLQAVTLEITREAVTEGRVESLPFWAELLEQGTFSGLDRFSEAYPDPINYLTYKALRSN